MLNLLERCFAVLMLLYLTGGLTGFLAGDSLFNVWRLEDNPLLLTIQTAMYGITLGFVVLHWRKFMRALRASGWVLALALLALASTLWSSDPDFTFHRSLVLIATTTFGIYFGSRYELARQVRLLAWTFIILAMLSAACALLLPQYGIDSQLHPGDWQGILGHKSRLGEMMALAILVLWSAKGVLPRAVRIAALPFCAVVMLMSGSRTALLVSLALVLLLPSYRILRARMTTLVPLAIVFLAAGAGVVLLAIRARAHLLASLGREATLTGRTKIWTAVWRAISSHLVLGYGFSGFWAGLHGESARVSAMLGFVARHAHNGFLDLWLELGIAGLALFTAGYFQAAGNGFRLLRVSPDRLACWPLLYLAFLFLCDLVERLVPRQNDIYWAVYVAVVVSAAQAVRKRRQSKAASPVRAGLLLEPLEQQPGHLPRRSPGRLGNLHPQAGRGAA